MELVPIIEELLSIENPFYVKEVLRDKENMEVHIHIGIEKTYRPHADCGNIHQYYERTWEHINLFEYRCFIQCRVPVYHNLKTGKTEALQVSFSRKNSRFTLAYENKVLDLLKEHKCLQTVANQLNIRTQRVEKIYHDYTEIPFKNHDITPASDIGVDETSTRKGHDYFTLFVDMEGKQILDIYSGKGGDVFEKFFHANINPAAVKNISIDMSPAFISGCGTYFPWVSPTFDKWHVLKLIGKHLSNLRKSNPTQKETINFLFDKMEDFYDRSSPHKAESQLTFIADYAEEQFGQNDFSNSIRRHFDGIVEHIRTHLTNGLLEGINSKVQTIKRIARGFRSVKNFKKMVFFIFGVIEPKIPTTT